ncbi:MAG: lytic transglycosylase domain-containing protein [Armatimonadetes bacterium]|nr:lytic transglycosylase domain-containing protein [Armatimonadota bacterium]
MRAVLILLVLTLFPGSAAGAREWFRPAHAGRKYVNVDLTPARGLRHPAHTSWHRQLVLWDGVISEHRLREGKHHLRLSTPSGEVPVHFPGKVLNLESDRTGYRVGIKGELQVSSGKVSGLTGRSVILLSPPRPWRLHPVPSQAPEARDRLYPFLCWWVSFHNPDAPAAQVEIVALSILRESRKNDIDPLFLASLIQVESAFDVDAVSVSGAIGLGQLMPFTAEGLGVDPHEPAQNVAGAARMLAGLLREWQHGENPRAAALASYNAGPNLIRRWGGRVPRISQTANYVFFIGYVHQVMTRIAGEFSS